MIITDLYSSSQQSVLRKHEVLKRTGLSNTSIFERTKDGTFPKSISLGGRAVGYLEHEVSAVIAARAAGQDDEQIKALVELMVTKRERLANDYITALTA